MKTIVIVLMLFCAGCLPATQAEIKELTGQVANLLSGVDSLQETTGQLAADGLVNKEKVDKINAEIDKVQEHTAIIAKEVETAESPIEAAQKGWDASKPFNPYYGYGAAALAILKMFFDDKKNKQTEAKYSAAKQGIEKFKNENPEKAAELYNNIGDARKAKKIA